MKLLIIHATLILLIFHAKLKGQNCVLDTVKENVSLLYLVSHTNNCKNIDIIKYCLKYEKSMHHSTLSQFLIKSNYLLDTPKEKNTNRMERFAALYYIHHSFIIGDVEKKEIIRLKIDNKYIIEPYLSKEYRTEEEREHIIYKDIQNCKEDDEAIKLYYEIIQKYIKDYKKHGKNEAITIYLASLKNKKIEWQYDY